MYQFAYHRPDTLDAARKESEEYLTALQRERAEFPGEWPARPLGVESYGTFIALLAVTGILGVTVELGFSQLLTRRVARQPRAAGHEARLRRVAGRRCRARALVPRRGGGRGGDAGYACSTANTTGL